MDIAAIIGPEPYKQTFFSPIHKVKYEIWLHLTQRFPMRSQGDHLEKGAAALLFSLPESKRAK